VARDSRLPPCGRQPPDNSIIKAGGAGQVWVKPASRSVGLQACAFRSPALASFSFRCVVFAASAPNFLGEAADALSAIPTAKSQWTRRPFGHFQMAWRYPLLTDALPERRMNPCVRNGPPLDLAGAPGFEPGNGGIKISLIIQ